ncbi:MAG TPA: SpoIIE family protein phosphatase [Acidimicrobiales bacterium]|nr:SpoIIE family protein phosphatase [Acidimicrobiales bacterium]
MGEQGDLGSTASQHEVAQLGALHRLTAALVAATTVEFIYQAALDVLLGSLGADRAAVLLQDPDGVIRCKASRGLSERYRAVAEGHSPWQRDEPAPEPVVMADATVAEGLGALRDTILGEGIRSLAFIPLLYGDNLLGNFMVCFDSPHAYCDEELALARTVAAHVAFALERRRLEEELRLAADQLGATLNAVSEGIVVHAPDGTVLLANETGATMMGYASVADLVGGSLPAVAGRFDLFMEDGRPLGLDDLPGPAARRGEEPPELLLRWRQGDTGAEHISLVKARPVRDDAGRVRFAVSVFRDVTERQLAVEALRMSEARLAFLATASRTLLRTSLEPRRVLQEAARLAVPELADWCVVQDITDAGDVEIVAGPPGDEGFAELASRLALPGDVTPEQPVLEDRHAGSTSGADGTSVGQSEIRSVMRVPLQAGGRTIGVLTLAAGRDRPPYAEADLALAEEFGARVAAATVNARSFAREHATAETLARGLLPGRLPEIAGLDVAARYRASGDVGGDFYDCFQTGPDRWMLVVGDVCGRGIAAASMTGLTRHTIRAAALHGGSPAEVLRDLNRLLLDAADEEMAAWFSPDAESGPSFCTVCLAEVTRTSDGARIVISVGGHPLPVVVRNDGRLEEVGRPGSLVGVLAAFDVAEASVDLSAGDALVLYTDGITERRHGGRLFEDELPAVLRAAARSSAHDLAHHLEDAAVTYTPKVPDDDIAVLVLAVPATDVSGGKVAGTGTVDVDVEPVG